MRKKYEIFISYRRKGGYDTAKLIFDRLRLDGYSVSFDIDTLTNGNFDKELEQRVSDCKDFLLVLSPNSFDRFFNQNPAYEPDSDWFRREISQAVKTNKNIVPLILDGFSFPKTLPDDVKDVANKNAIDIYPKYFEAAYEKMKSFLISKPSWVVKHKKILISVISSAFLAIIASLYLAMTEYRENLKTMEAWLQEQRLMRQQERTLHWNGPGNEIGEIIFEKITETGMQKTECSGRGMIATLNKYNCRGETEIICSYSPKISFTNCDGSRNIAYLEKEMRFRTAPQPDSASAIAELANKLREADFSDWVSGINKLK